MEGRYASWQLALASGTAAVEPQSLSEQHAFCLQTAAGRLVSCPACRLPGWAKLITELVSHLQVLLEEATLAGIKGELAGLRARVGPQPSLRHLIRVK